MKYNAENVYFANIVLVDRIEGKFFLNTQAFIKNHDDFLLLGDKDGFSYKKYNQMIDPQVYIDNIRSILDVYPNLNKEDLLSIRKIKLYLYKHIVLEHKNNILSLKRDQNKNC